MSTHTTYSMPEKMLSAVRITYYRLSFSVIATVSEYKLFIVFAFFMDVWMFVVSIRSVRNKYGRTRSGERGSRI